MTTNYEETRMRLMEADANAWPLLEQAPTRPGSAKIIATAGAVTLISGAAYLLAKQALTR